MSDRFILEKQGHVTWLKFNRPERLNAMTIESWGEFNEHLAVVDKDRDDAARAGPGVHRHRAGRDLDSAFGHAPVLGAAVFRPDDSRPRMVEPNTRRAV